MIAKVRSRAKALPPNRLVRTKNPPPKEGGYRRNRRGKPRLQTLFQGGGDGGAEVRGSFDGADAGGGHRSVLVPGGTLTAADNRASVAHAASRRRSLPGDEAHNRLLHIGFNPFRGAFFGVPADFTDQDDGLRAGIIVEKLDGIEEGRADDGIAADADAGGLANAEARQLIDGFVSERAAAADHANVSLLVNAAGHDADFALARRNDARTIRADEACFIEVHNRRHANHVDDGDALGDANNERDLRIGGLENRVSREGRRNENHGSIRARGFRGIGDGVEHRALEVLRAAFSGGNAAHNIRAVFDHLLRVKGAFAAGEALNDQARFFIDENAHRAPPARATTFSAPSFMPSAMVKFNPLSRRICWPRSTLVPSMRTTTGTFTCKSLAAATTPVASTSQRRMPPKILMNTAFTSGSLMRMRKAFFTCSAEAPPPTSRKFAGEPPAYLMMSMVAMARPAPLTMQATLPSSLM